MDETGFNQLLSLMAQQNTQLLNMMAQQNKLLSDLMSHLKGSQVGLTIAPRTIYIYANRTKGCDWYTVEDSDVKPVVQTALSGYLTDVQFVVKERRGEDVDKIRIFMQAGEQQYVIESGDESHFAKGFLAAAASLTPDQIAHNLVTIVPQQGKDKSVLFCRVHCGGQIVKATYNDQTDWQPIVEQALANVKDSNPGDSEPQPVFVQPTRQPVAQVVQPTCQPIAAAPTPDRETDLSGTIADIGIQIERLGWSKKTGSQYLQKKYLKKTRAELTEAQLREFLQHLEGLPTAEAKPVEPELVTAGVRNEPWEDSHY